MPFDSCLYLLIALPAICLLFRAFAPMGAAWLGRFLLLLSIAWVAIADPRALVLLPCLAVASYGFGLALAAPGEREGRMARMGILCLGIVVAFLPLLFVRFFECAGALGLPALLGPRDSSLPGPGGMALPCLAFWALVQTAWLVGVYQRRTEPEGLGRHLLFSLFFPTVWAGPIVRYEQVGGQFDRLGVVSFEDTGKGLALLVAGLAKKLLLADPLARVVASLYAGCQEGYLSASAAWLAVFAFSLQVYFDFSGLTDMARGSARLLGIRLPANFRSPYRATGFIDFWQRWHITLSAWLRDFLFLPLGGAYCGSLRRLICLLVSVLFAGLWHGAGVLFLLWALFHALCLLANYGFRTLVRGSTLEVLAELLPVRMCFTLITFLLVSLSWALLRCPSLADAGVFFTALAGAIPDAPGALELAGGMGAALPVVLGLIAVFCLPASQEFVDGARDGSRPRLHWAPTGPNAVLLALLAFACLCAAGDPLPFIF